MMDKSQETRILPLRIDENIVNNKIVRRTRRRGRTGGSGIAKCPDCKGILGVHYHGDRPCCGGFKCCYRSSYFS